MQSLDHPYEYFDPQEFVQYNFGVAVLHDVLSLSIGLVNKMICQQLRLLNQTKLVGMWLSSV